MPTAAATQWEPSARLMPKNRATKALCLNVKLADGTYLKGQVLGELLGNNEVQTTTVDATGGTFAPIFGGVTGGAVAYNATIAVYQAALEAMSSIGVGNVVVAGSAGAYILTFQNALGFQNVAQLTYDSSLLTGNTHTATAGTTTQGSAGTKGTYGKYKYTNSDGSQIAKCFLQYPCTVVSGAITMSGEWPGVTELAAPAFFTGEFDTTELVGLDQNAVDQLGGHLLNGTVASGTVSI